MCSEKFYEYMVNEVNTCLTENRLEVLRKEDIRLAKNVILATEKQLTEKGFHVQSILETIETTHQFNVTDDYIKN